MGRALQKGMSTAHTALAVPNVPYASDRQPQALRPLQDQHPRAQPSQGSQGLSSQAARLPRRCLVARTGLRRSRSRVECVGNLKPLRALRRVLREHSRPSET